MVNCGESRGLSQRITRRNVSACGQGERLGFGVCTCLKQSKIMTGVQAGMGFGSLKISGSAVSFHRYLSGLKIGSVGMRLSHHSHFHHEINILILCRFNGIKVTSSTCTVPTFSL
jgi:hypothetical protein